MLFGVGYQSNSIGTIISMIQQGDRDSEEMNDRIQTLKNYKK
jgi:CRP-like cAMP-binding protein